MALKKIKKAFAAAKKYTSLTVTGLALLTSCTSPSHDYGSVEARVGSRGSTVDARFTGSLGDRTGYFLRTLRTQPRKGDPSQVNIADLTYALTTNPNAKIDAVAEVQTLDKPELRAGIQGYLANQRGDFAYGLLTAGSKPKFNLEGFLIGHKELGKGFFAEGDVLMRYGPNHQFSNGVLRLGKKFGGFEIGAYAEANAFGPDPTKSIETSVGIFGRFGN